MWKLDNNVTLSRMREKRTDYALFASVPDSVPCHKSLISRTSMRVDRAVCPLFPQALSIVMLVGAVTLAAQSPAPAAQSSKYGVGQPATPEQIRSLGSAIAPDGSGLPEGSGTLAAAPAVYASSCAPRHPVNAAGTPAP